MFNHVNKKNDAYVNLANILLVSSLAAVLTACGGGGGGGGSGSAGGGGPAALPVDRDPVTVVVPTSALQNALTTGDATALTDPLPIAQYANALWSKHYNDQVDRFKNVVGDTVPEYAPGAGSSMIAPTDVTFAQPLLVSDKGYTMASISVSGGGRGVAYGHRVLDAINEGQLAAYNPSFKRVLSWLVSNDANKPLPPTMKVAFSGAYGGMFNPGLKEQLAGFKKLGVTVEEVKCDILVKTDCLKGIDLLVLGGNWPDGTTGIGELVRSIMASGVPIMYLHNFFWWDNKTTEDLLSGMHLRFDLYGGNNAVKDKVSAGRSADANSQKVLADINATQVLINDMANNKFEMKYDWSKCETWSICSKVPGLESQLMRPIKDLKIVVDSYTEKGINIFTQPETVLLRPLVLWSDVVRKQRVFQQGKAWLDKEKNPAEHKKSVISDHFVPYIRAVATTNPDLGRFMRPINQSIPVTTSPEVIDVKIATANNFTAIGRLAIPGKTFTIELLEGGNAKLSVFMNTIHPAATKYWGPDFYSRPKHLQSPSMPLKVGQPLTIASPYGGPIQLQYEGGSAGQVVKLRIKGVGKHPFLDARDGKFETTEFAAAMNDPMQDWFEIKLPSFEVHAKMEIGAGDLRNVYENDVKELIREAKLYLVDQIEATAGFSRPGRTLPPYIQSVCSKYGWDCTSEKLHGRSNDGSIQHGLHDVDAKAGGGSNGNPYDASWPFNPRGWGESHEIGHNLQRPHHYIYGWNTSAEVSVNVFPLHKNWQMRQDNLKNLSANRLELEGIRAYKLSFEKLKAAQSDVNKFEGARQRIWGSDGSLDERLVFYVQWVHYFTELKASLGGTDFEKEARGWNTHTLLYLHQRLFDSIKEADWMAKRDSLGFGTYAKKPEVNGNDYMLIMLSMLSEHDQRPTFDLWGIGYSDEAAAQVAAFKFAVQPAFYYANTKEAPYINAKKIDLSGPAANWVWPLK